VEHVAEGQETNRGFLKGVLEEVMGSQKIYNLEDGERGGSQKTITPSSFRYEDQWVGKVRDGRGAGFSDIYDALNGAPAVPPDTSTCLTDQRTMPSRRGHYGSWL
jgi:hypothetical protein